MTEIRNEDGDWSGPEFAQIASRIAQRTGLAFSGGRVPSAEAGIRRAMARAHVGDPARYHELVQAESAEFDALVAELTVGETYFFREPGQFAFIRGDVLPELLTRRSERDPIQAWSAGCASGEEPYSLAILLRDAGLGGRSRILGTDISRARLASAQRARYGAWSLRGVSDDVIERNFIRDDVQFQLRREVRSRVSFRYLNLLDLSSGVDQTVGCRPDLILCRNVLIYFDPNAVERVASRLLGLLCDDGWLFLGASDPPIADVAPCDVVVTGAGIAYRKRSRAHRPVPHPRVDGMATVAPAPSPSSPSTPASSPRPGERGVEELMEQARRSHAAGDYESAAGIAERALTLGVGSPEPWLVRARALANLGRLEDAGRTCSAALDLHHDCAELVHLHALLLSVAGRHGEAAAACRRSLYLDRSLIAAHVTLASSLARLDDRNGARRAFRNAERLLLELGPADAVPASDGTPAGRLLADVRTRLRLLRGALAR